MRRFCLASHPCPCWTMHVPQCPPKEDLGRPVQIEFLLRMHGDWWVYFCCRGHRTGTERCIVFLFLEAVVDTCTVFVFHREKKKH